MNSVLPILETGQFAEYPRRAVFRELQSCISIARQRRTEICHRVSSFGAEAPVHSAAGARTPKIDFPLGGTLQEGAGVGPSQRTGTRFGGVVSSRDCRLFRLIETRNTMDPVEAAWKTPERIAAAP